MNRSRLTGIGFAVILFGAGIYLCREFFFRQGLGYMNSMHGFWMAIARLAGDAWWTPTWWPQWDAGMPFEFTYAPLVPALTALLAWVGGMPVDRAFYAVSATVFCIGPVSLFLFAWLWSKKPGASFVAGAVALFASPSQWITPDSNLAWAHFWDARNMYLSFVWDETPHLLALALLPAAVLLMKVAMDRRGPAVCIAAIAVIATMLLASAFATTLLTVASVCLAASVAPQSRRRELWLPPLLGAVAWALVSPWIPISLLWTILKNAAMRAESNWTLTSWVELAIVAAGFLILHWVLRHGRTSPLLHFTALFAWIVTCIAAFHQYLGWHFFPQAGRYKVEVDWAWSVLLVFALLPVLRRLPRVVPVMLCLALLGAAYGRVVSHRRFAKQLARDGTKLDQSIERRAALWAEQNLPGRRILFVGSMAQWANLFSDGPQLTGGSYPTTYNDVQRLASETVVWGTAAEPESFVVWLKAFGVHAVAVPGPKSPEFWKPFPNPPIWEPLLPVLWREDDTTIYRIPHGSNELARVVPKSSLVHMAPRNGDDTSALRRYVAALNEPTAGRTAFRWISRNRAIVRADTGPGEVASVQVNYHPGWKARCGRRTLPLHRDGLGLIWIGEACNEDIELTYDGGIEARLLGWLSVLTALGCLGWWVSEAVWLAAHSSSD